MTLPQQLTEGLVRDLWAARAAGRGPGVNEPPLSSFADAASDDVGSLVNFAYDLGERPRTNEEAGRATWEEQARSLDFAIAGVSHSEWRTEPRPHLHLPGTNGNATYVGHSAYTATALAWTFEFYLRHLDRATTWYQPLVVMGTYLSFGLRAGINASGAVRAWTSQHGGTLNPSPAGQLPLGEFAYLALVYDNATSTCRMNLNGTWHTLGSGTYVRPTAATSIEVGRDFGNGPLRADVAAFRHYGAALSDAQIEQNRAWLEAGDPRYASSAYIYANLDAARAVRGSGWGGSV